MALSRDFRETIISRVQADPRFARSMLDEAVTMFLSGEPETARVVLRDLVNATIGFEALAQATGRPGKSLHRMLSRHGNPGMDNLAAVFVAVQEWLHVQIRVKAVAA